MTTKKARRVALYLRTSHADRTTENQRRELERAARRAGWPVVAIYEDNGVSGAKGRDGRPGFDQMLKDAHQTGPRHRESRCSTRQRTSSVSRRSHPRAHAAL